MPRKAMIALAIGLVIIHSVAFFIGSETIWVALSRLMSQLILVGLCYAIASQRVKLDIVEEKEEHTPRVTGSLSKCDIITALELARLSVNNVDALEQMDLSDEAAKELGESLERWGEDENVGADRSWQTVDYIDALEEMPAYDPKKSSHSSGFDTGTSNAERAKAGFRMASLGGYDDNGLDEIHIDAITNLLHSAHESGLDVHAVLRQGLSHFVHEAS